jgi:hypothetical protein
MFKTIDTKPSQIIENKLYQIEIYIIFKYRKYLCIVFGM